MKVVMRFFCIVLFVIALSIIAVASEKKTALTFEDCVKKALELSPEVSASNEDVAVYKAKKMQADSALLPQIESLFVFGPSPEARAHQTTPVVKTKEKTVISGVFGMADITVVQPLYTFGLISSYQQAAQSGIKASEAKTDTKKSEIIQRITQAYYGLLLANDAIALITEIKEGLQNAIKKAEEMLEKDSPSADELNIFKLKSFLGEVNRHLHEAQKGKQLATHGLLVSLGMSANDELVLADSSLQKLPPLELKDDIHSLIAKSQQFKPEFKMLKEGLNARAKLVEAEQSKRYPMIFLGAKASVASSTNRDKIDNPYISDYFNHAYGAVFLGAKWNIDFGITKGRIAEAKAEYNKLEHLKKLADDGIPFLVRKAYFEFEEASKNIVELEKSWQNARKWLVSAVANYDLGIADAKDMADAAVAYATLKGNYLKALYSQRIAYANLMSAVGLDVVQFK